MESSILWQNEDQSVLLIDIPRSIALAQGHGSFRHILSEPPPQTPYPSQEPKSAKAKAKLAATESGDVGLHASYRETLTTALEKVHENFSGSYCCPRLFTKNFRPAKKKRKLSEDPAPVHGTSNELNTPTQGDHAGLPDDFFTELTSQDTDPKYIISADPLSNSNVSCDGKGTSTFLSNSDKPTSISISAGEGSSNNATYTFHVPPRASFVLGDCTNGKALRDAVRQQYIPSSSPSTFNVILLDPPWPNSSVKRTHKTPGTTYRTSESMFNLRELLLDTKLEILMAEDGCVGVWITNKPAVRELVLGEEGVFACWGVELVEEWIWLKVTVDGKPVATLDAVWRKPYEVLVWGRRRRKGAVREGGGVAPSVRRRTLMAVPDVHSRKPCLLELLHLLGQANLNARVLEVFARNLVCGWWSWGNECIKFNWDGYWREEERLGPFVIQDQLLAASACAN